MQKRHGPIPQSVAKGQNASASLQLQQPPLPQQPHPQQQVSKNTYNIQIIPQQIGIFLQHRRMGQTGKFTLKLDASSLSIALRLMAVDQKWHPKIVSGATGHGKAVQQHVAAGSRMEQEQLLKLQKMEVANAQDHQLPHRAATRRSAQVQGEKAVHKVYQMQKLFSSEKSTMAQGSGLIPILAWSVPLDQQQPTTRQQAPFTLILL